MADWKASCHPDILTVLDYWDGKRRGRHMPSREDIDPTELVKFLPYISIIDVVEDARRFVYRLVGTMEVEVRGYDPTGKSVGEGYFASSADSAMANYQKVWEPVRLVADKVNAPYNRAAFDAESKREE